MLTRVTPWLVAAAAYGGATLVLFWPITTHLSSAWPHDALDPALNTMILWQDAHVLPFSGAWWNLPMFWPISGALAFSEHLLGISVLTTPLQWLGVGPIGAYNAAFLCSFPLTALAAHALAVVCLKRHDAGWIAGCVFGFNPYRVSHLSHLQMLWAFGMPVALMALHGFTDGRRRWLIVFALALLVQAASNGYYLMYFPVLVCAWLLWFAKTPSSVFLIILTGIIALLPMMPLLFVYAKLHQTLGLTRGVGEIAAFSAGVTSVFSASPDLVVWHGLPHASSESQLFPGAIALLVIATTMAIDLASIRAAPTQASKGWKLLRVSAAIIAAGCLVVAASLLLVGPWTWRVGGITIASAGSIEKPLSVAAAFALVMGVATNSFRQARRQRSIFAFYALAGVAMLLFSLGPRPTVYGLPILYRPPYEWLLHLPGFPQLRAPGRFGMLFALTVAMAAAAGFARLTSTLAPTWRRAATVTAVTLILVESWPRIDLAAPASPIQALQEIRDHTPVLELPLGSLDRDVAAAYRSIQHGHPTVNGYSGYEPPHYRILKAGLDHGDAGVLDRLARDSDLIVAVNHRQEFARWTAVLGSLPVIADDGEWRLYRVPMRPQAEVPLGPELPVRRVTADPHNETAARMIDGDTRTTWMTGRPQAGGEYVEIDLGELTHVGAVRLTLGTFTGEFPRALAVECSTEGRVWDTCWRGSTAALAVRAVMDFSLNAAMIIPISAQGIRFVRLRQTSADAISEWAIPELTVFGPP